MQGTTFDAAVAMLAPKLSALLEMQVSLAMELEAQGHCIEQDNGVLDNGNLGFKPTA